MKQIYVFTEEHKDTLAQRLENAMPYGCDHVISILADISAEMAGLSESIAVEAELRDFLEKNDYIHLDAFARICLEDIAKK
ncbi:MAG: hypothetical protein FWE34_03655 [Defluviitaleaceae bacterium]|nr:hypothetical protein [Defluviitaleaceae bacterium]